VVERNKEGRNFTAAALIRELVKACDEKKQKLAAADLEASKILKDISPICSGSIEDVRLLIATRQALRTSRSTSNHASGIIGACLSLRWNDQKMAGAQGCFAVPSRLRFGVASGALFAEGICESREYAFCSISR
jgi:hypothetical protein